MPSKDETSGSVCGQKGRGNLGINMTTTEDLDSARTEDPGDFPRVVLIDTTNLCNLRCSMCGHAQMTRKKGIMAPEMCRKVLDEVAERDKTIRVWMVFFGEALLIKNRLYPLIAYAKSLGLEDVVLNSNGNLLDEAASVSLIEAGLDAIYVGIDAFTPETYARLRVQGKYDRVVANVNRLIRLKQEMRASRPEVYVQFVEMAENAHEKAEFKAYWTERGAIVKIRPKVSWAGTVAAPNLHQDKQRYPCYWAMRTANICWDGRVVLCSVDFDAKYVAGNVAEASLASIWQGSLKRIRRLHANCEYETLPEFCRNCRDWQSARAEFYAK